MILAWMKSRMKVVTPVNENPMNIPRVPPTDPIIPIVSKIRYSCCTVVIIGGAN